MKTIRLPGLASLLACLAIILFAGCAATKTTPTWATTDTATNFASADATIMVTAPKPATEQERRTTAESRQTNCPSDGRSFTPVDQNIAELGIVKDDEAGALNPYVMAIVGCYPTDGSYPYRCQPMEYELYNGVTQNLWYKGRVVAKGHPNGTRCSYCCGLTFEVFCRAMQYRNVQKGLAPDDFNGMSFSDLFNLLQFWYIEGPGDSPQLGITSYGLGRKIENLEDAKPGDFLDFSRNNKTGHSVIFIDWTRDAAGNITGFKYFSSNSVGVGYATEHFEDCGGKVMHKYFRLARVGSVDGYQCFDRTAIPVRHAYAP